MKTVRFLVMVCLSGVLASVAVPCFAKSLNGSQMLKFDPVPWDLKWGGAQPSLVITNSSSKTWDVFLSHSTSCNIEYSYRSSVYANVGGKTTHIDPGGSGLFTISPGESLVLKQNPPSPFKPCESCGTYQVEVP